MPVEDQRRQFGNKRYSIYPAPKLNLTHYYHHLMFIKYLLNVVGKRIVPKIPTHEAVH